MISHPWLQFVLAILALYHLGVGSASVLSFRGAQGIAGVYGADIAYTPQMRYAVRMLGLYALTLGSLLALAAAEPARYQALIYAVAGLQLARAGCRIHFRHELQGDLNMSVQRNAIAVSLLAAEATVLLSAG
jgi:hypothetical protein